MNSKNHDMLSRAYTEALSSPDISSQNGALLVTDYVDGNSSSVFGMNHFYYGIPPEQEDRKIKLQRIEHAERDAIYTAAIHGQPTINATLYCPWVACHDCARAIIGSAIGKVVYHMQRYELTDPRWKSEIDEAIGWMEAAGIKVIGFNGPIKGKPILISGRLWSPETLEYV